MIWNLPALPENALDRFTMLLRYLLLYVGKKHRPGVDMAVHTAVWWYLAGVGKRFARLVERFRAGTLHPLQPRETPRAPPSDAPAAAAPAAQAAMPPRPVRRPASPARIRPPLKTA
jgi:hypothetical protein